MQEKIRGESYDRGS